MAARRRSPAGSRGGAEPHYEVILSSRGLPRALLTATICLLLLHAALSIYHYQLEELPWLLRQLFDVDEENNLPTWFSSFLLLTTSALLFFCVQKKKHDGSRWVRHWNALAIGFLLMSIDEVAGVHESINSIIVMTWAIPGAILAGLIGLACVPFLLALPRRTAISFGIAGAVYLTGAVGIEIIGNEMVGDRLEDTLGYSMATLAEESLEMFGVVAFIYALLAYMRGPGAGVRAAVKVKGA